MNAQSAAVRRTTQTLNHIRGRHHHAMGSPVPADPPWRATFLSHIQRMESPVFALSSLRQVDRASSSASSSPSTTSPLSSQHVAAAPRVRTVVFRGLWAALSVNPKNPAERNPDTFTSHLPTFTTDARMDKMPELEGESTAAAGSDGGRGGTYQSGGGGLVEGVFWAEEDRTQWRLRGRAYVLGPDIDSETGAPVRAALEPHMRRVNGGTAGPWSWSREVTAHFGNLGPLMRGTFRNPPPGTPRSQEPGQGLGPGQRVEDLEDEVARRNFRVVVIVPDEVDRVDLSDPENGRRWNYKLEDEDGSDSWKVTELWP
ncbi:Pyridoxal 5'-phosphate synthase [Purpureocillium takamizusanense]|uniref:Pyridoxal 5'-phosphate synthase n=1 Tax=Purpureocillium takamizusanense TaxID=2060973 RepID=A0A9Q8QLN5_9HYPO|nr:Pyridoxal 5'-phosphate synthase [Purpureocillium takamizusanense]UNI22000.1 Pyridoxal 5'-phosphate synthase [Purpureocillium takamizusanense]